MPKQKRLLIHMGTLSEAFRCEEKLRALAASFGLTTRRGSSTGELNGNISALIQSIADDEIVVLKRAELPTAKIEG